MSRTALAAVLAAVVLGLASGCGGGGGGGHRASSSRLTDLRSVEQLRSLFNSRSGEPRLIVLVSPT